MVFKMNLPETPPPSGSDRVLAYMKALGLPLPRETYLGLNLPEGQAGGNAGSDTSTSDFIPVALEFWLVLCAPHTLL